MRKSAYEIDQSRGELRKRLQWIVEAEQGMKSVGERRKRRQWILTAGKTGKGQQTSKRRKLGNVIVVNA
jgi:hypothetical protein